MAFDVTASREIAASPQAVAAVQFDATRDPEWIGGVDEVEWLTPAPLAQDSEVRRLGGFMGRPIEWIMHVDAFEPDRLVAMTARVSPFPMQVDYQLEPRDGGRATRASIRIRGAGKGMYGLPAFILGPMVRRSVGGDLKRLEGLVLRRGEVSGRGS